MKKSSSIRSIHLESGSGRTPTKLSTWFPRITNYLTSNSVFRWIPEAVLGVTSEQKFPEFARETFREWWEKGGGSRIDSGEKMVAYLHGCYTNYNTPEIGKA